MQYKFFFVCERIYMYLNAFTAMRNVTYKCSFTSDEIKNVAIFILVSIFVV